MRSRAAISKDGDSEFALPRTVNALFRGALNAEVAMTLRGLRFPCGGSRVMVAEKIRSDV
jgi:hypothetical protein